MTNVLHACKDYPMHTSTSLINTLHTISSDDYSKVLLFWALVLLHLQQPCPLDIANVFVALYTCLYSCMPHFMCACGYDTSECIMSAVAYVKLYTTAVIHTGYHCHVAYNTVACILSQRMCLLATHLLVLLNVRGLCKGSEGNLGRIWEVEVLITGVWQS